VNTLLVFCIYVNSSVLDTW